MERIMIQEPNKPAEIAESYRLISLLPALSKLFEKLLLPSLTEIMKGKEIPKHHFGFRYKHATIEKIQRIVNKKSTYMDAGRYCTADFSRCLTGI